MVDGPKTRRSRPRGKATQEDIDENKELLQGVADTIGGIVQAAYGIPAALFTMPDENADRIARPLSRILARYEHVQSAVREISDPALLVGALAAYAAPRVLEVQRIMEAAKVANREGLQGPAAYLRPVPAPPAPNGAVQPSGRPTQAATVRPQGPSSRLTPEEERKAQVMDAALKDIGTE